MEEEESKSLKGMLMFTLGVIYGSAIGTLVTLAIAGTPSLEAISSFLSQP